MLRFLADENLHGAIVRGLVRRNKDLDILRTQDLDLSGASDAELLEWAAAQDRIIITHDVATLTREAWERVRKQLPVPGVIQVKSGLAHARVIDDLLLMAEASVPDEWQGQIIFLPL